jgi:hypothetical protein
MVAVSASEFVLFFFPNALAKYPNMLSSREVLIVDSSFFSRFI